MHILMKNCVADSDLQVAIVQLSVLQSDSWLLIVVGFGANVSGITSVGLFALIGCICI